MTNMRYEAPETLDAAVALLSGANAGGRVLAGGTDVLVLLHAEVIDPDILVDIKNIPDVGVMSEAGGGVDGWFGCIRYECDR